MSHAFRCFFAGALLSGAALTHAGGDSPVASTRPTTDESLLQTVKLPADGAGLVEFFQRRASAPRTQAHISALTHGLGDRSFKIRQRVMTELIALGPVTLPILRAALPGSDLERSQRIQICINAITAVPEQKLLAAAARVLLARSPQKALPALLTYLASAPNAGVAEELLMVLASSAERMDGAHRKVLGAALSDRKPACRAAAALLLGRIGNAGERAKVRLLLSDPDSMIRLRAAQGLLHSGDSTAQRVLPILAMKGESYEIRQQAGYLLMCTNYSGGKTSKGTIRSYRVGANLVGAVMISVHAAVRRHKLKQMLRHLSIRRPPEGPRLAARYVEVLKKELSANARLAAIDIARAEQLLRLWGIELTELELLKDK